MLSTRSSRAPLVLRTTVQGALHSLEIKIVIKIRQEKRHLNFFSFCLFLGRTVSKTVAQQAACDFTGNYLIRHLIANYKKHNFFLSIWQSETEPYAIHNTKIPSLLGKTCLACKARQVLSENNLIFGFNWLGKGALEARKTLSDSKMN